MKSFRYICNIIFNDWQSSFRAQSSFFFLEDLSVEGASANQSLDGIYSPSEVAAAVTFTVGLFQVLFDNSYESVST